MYRIELAPGEETVFRTIEELAIGVRNGLVTRRARIYHSASQKWLPIEFHPHYKRALELPPIRPDASAARAPERAETSLNFAAPQPAAPEAPAVAPTFAAPTFAAPVFTQPAVEAPAAVEEEKALAKVPAPPPMALPSGAASPVLQLPTISYPEITPAEEPVAEPASSAARSRRPLQLAGALVVLSLGAYAMMSAFSPSRGAAAAPTVADRPSLPPVVDSGVALTPAADQAKPARAPAPVAMTQPASSGFAPALEPRAIVSTSSATARPGNASSAAGALKDSSIAPAPIQVDLALPSLPGAESLAPSPGQHGDSAMKRILRAVSGGKDIPQRP